MKEIATTSLRLDTQQRDLRKILFGGLLVVGQALFLWAPIPVRAHQSYETYYRFIKDYPADCETGWTEHPQGATHDDGNWYITQVKALWRIPVGHDLKSVSNSDAGVSRIELDDFPVLTKALFNHFGDPTYYEYGGRGFVLVPLEGDGGTGIAVFRADATLSYVTYAPLAQAHAAWCAVDQADPQGHLYSAPDYDFADTIYKYSVEWDKLRYSTPPRLVLHHESSLSLPVISAGLQGGEISPDGRLLYLSMFGGLSFFSGIRVYDMSTGKQISESANGSGWFNYEIHPGKLEVAEGLTIWDLDDGRAPNIRGQLHVFMFYDDKPDSLRKDNAYFKHYDRTISVDGALGKDEDRGPSFPFKTLGFAHNFAWDGARIKIRAGSYPEMPTLSKRIQLVASGGTASIEK